MQGPTGRPGMIGQPGIVGEKVKKFTVTPFARIMYETIGVFVDSLHISFCLSKGEDGEAGDPGSVGFPGRIVSLFPPFGGHILYHQGAFRLAPISFSF